MRRCLYHCTMLGTQRPKPVTGKTAVVSRENDQLAARRPRTQAARWNLYYCVTRVFMAQMVQMAQSAVCKPHHSVDRRLCRWRVRSLGRLSLRQMMTPEFIATMFGVRRDDVTKGANELQKLGTIRYADGQITLVHRSKLEQLSCECYVVIKNPGRRLLSFPLG